MNNYDNEECAHSHANKLGCPECGVDFGVVQRLGNDSGLNEYTPGPWIIGVDNVVYDGDLRQPICDVSFRSESINDRNALLIAAAPNLLEALEKLIAKAYKQNFNDAYPEVIEIAEIAIARAKGEQV